MEKEKAVVRRPLDALFGGSSFFFCSSFIRFNLFLSFSLQYLVSRGGRRGFIRLFHGRWPLVLLWRFLPVYSCPNSKDGRAERNDGADNG